MARKRRGDRFWFFAFDGHKRHYRKNEDYNYSNHNELQLINKLAEKQGDLQAQSPNSCYPNEL